MALKYIPTYNVHIFICLCCYVCHFFSSSQDTKYIYWLLLSYLLINNMYVISDYCYVIL